MPDMLVSIYMPTRNRADLLRRAVESVLTQTYQNIELIVVDDNSSDQTEEYLRQTASADSRLTYFTNLEPRGAPASRNIAIVKSKGAFITGLDDDDAFAPERIGAFVDYWGLLTARGIKPACLYSQDIWLNDGVPSLATHKRSNVSADELFEYNYIGNQVFAPREHFIGAGLFDDHLPAWQDLEFWIRLLGQYGPALLLDMPTYLFDVTPRAGRISLQRRKIRGAFELVARKHSGSNDLKQQKLFLQMFQDGYGISPTMADWLRFLSFGKPKGFLRMLRSTNFKRRLHRIYHLRLGRVE